MFNHTFYALFTTVQRLQSRKIHNNNWYFLDISFTNLFCSDLEIPFRIASTSAQKHIHFCTLKYIDNPKKIVNINE